MKSHVLRVGGLATLVWLLACVVLAQRAPEPGMRPKTEMPSVITVPPEAQPSQKSAGK